MQTTHHRDLQRFLHAVLAKELAEFLEAKFCYISTMIITLTEKFRMMVLEVEEALFSTISYLSPVQKMGSFPHII